MKRLSVILMTMLLTLSFSACVDEDEWSDDPRGNFEALWQIFDEHYCFFDYKKQEFGVDWNEVHQRYAPMINNQMSTAQLFEVLTRMVGELRDGHVNISTAFDYGRNWTWHEDYPSNFSENVQREYLGSDYKISSSIRYRMLDDNVGYMYYGDFTSTLGAGNLDEILSYLAPCTGLILDIRDNTGGMLTMAETLAARFTNDKVLVGYIQHKTGAGHNDFSKMEEQWLKPSKGVRWQKPVVVLTNRSVFSAANEFVKYMKCLPGVTVVGDHTGGGAGMPLNSELPNGWLIRFSACPMYDRNGVSTEQGIEPDYNVQMNAEDAAKGIDTIIEYARQLLH